MDKSSGAPELHFFCLTLALHIAWAFIEACSVVSSEQTAGRFSWFQEFWFQELSMFLSSPSFA